MGPLYYTAQLSQNLWCRINGFVFYGYVMITPNPDKKNNFGATRGSYEGFLHKERKSRFFNNDNIYFLKLEFTGP